MPDGWGTDGSLSTTGAGTGSTWAQPPVSAQGINDYQVSFSVEIGDSNTCPRSFGVALRGSNDGYYAGGIRWDCDPVAVIWANQTVLASVPLALIEGTHTVALSAIGNQISLSIDGAIILTATSDLYPTGSDIGFWSDQVPVSITDVVVAPAYMPPPEGTPDDQ